MDDFRILGAVGWRHRAHRLLMGAAISLMLTTVAQAETAIGTGDGGTIIPKSSSPAKAGTVLADRDGDGMADGLATTISTLGDDGTVDVIVTLNRPAAASAAQDAVGPFKVNYEFHLINGFAATVTGGQAIAISKLPFVFRVEPVYTMTAALEGARRDTGVEAVHKALGPLGTSFTGAGIGICVVDSGIQWNHELFVDGQGNSKIVRVYRAIEPRGEGDSTQAEALVHDHVGHGTHVTSIAAGNGDGTKSAFALPLRGVAPDASLYIAQAIDADAFGNGVGLDSDVGIAIEWCADQAGVRVINLSVIGDSTQSDGLDFISRIVDAAVQKGKVVVAGAGNSDDPGDLHPASTSHLAIVVGAYGEWSKSTDLLAVAQPGLETDFTLATISNGPYLAPFSSRGVTSDGRIKPDIVAPGVTIAAAMADIYPDLLPCLPCYEIFSGTSMSTPYITGVVALMLEANGALTPSDVRNILFSTAQARGIGAANGAPVKDKNWGFGIVDAYAAVAKALEMGGGAPLGPTPTLYPSGYSAGTATVSKSGSVTIPFTVTDNSVPLTVGITGPHDGFVYTECFDSVFGTICQMEYRPDLDIFLYKVTGTGDVLVEASECPLTAAWDECGPFGLQEIIKIAQPELGDYKMVVKFLDVPGTPGSMNNATFTWEVSQGPMAPGNSPATVNAPPVADAGADVTSDQTLVSLSGAGSTDPDGSIDFYSWYWDGGQASGVSPSVTLPDGATTAIKLTVIDNLGASHSDEVRVTVDTGGGTQTLTANAGPDQAIPIPKRTKRVPVILDGSVVPSNTTDSYAWTWEGGSASEASPTVDLPAGVTIFTLTVTDGGGATDTDTVCIDVYRKNPSGTCGSGGGDPDNTAPVVSITAPTNNETFTSGTAVTFAGSASDAEDGDMTSSLAWSSNIDGSIGSGGGFNATLSDGTHTITATVTDNGSATDSKSVDITVGSGGGGTLSVATITFSAKGRSLTGTVTVNPAVSGVEVRVNFCRDDLALLCTFSNTLETTNNKGQAPYKIVGYTKGAPYTLTVNSLNGAACTGTCVSTYP